jgi:hypothetical protein
MAVVAFASLLTLAPPVEASTPPPPASSAFLTASSDPGDSIGLGQSYSFATPNDTFIGASDSTNNSVSLDLQAGNGEHWHLLFAAPYGQALTPGTYTDATRLGARGPANPGLDITADSRGCNVVSGSFTVLDATYDGYGYLGSFHATFEQHCEDATPALRGEIEIVDPTPPPAPTASIQLSVAPTGQLIRGGGVSLHGTVSCSSMPNLAPTISLTVSEPTKDGAANASTYTYADGNCSPTPTTWEAIVYPPAKTPFVKGTATVSASTGMQDPWYPLLTDTAATTAAVDIKEG